MHDEDGSSKLNELVKQQDASCGEVDWETLLTIGCGENRQEMLPQHGSQNETLRSMWKNQKGRIAEFSSLNTPQNMAIGPVMADPFISPLGFTMTPALSSKYTQVPSLRRKDLR